MGVGLTTLTTWRAMAASVAGSGHRERDIGCEDASSVVVTDEGALLLAVADGAGSARLAAEGSRRAVDAALSALGEGLDLCDVLAAARQALEPTDDETAAGIVIGDRATTLLVVRVDAERSTIETAQIGDGAVVVRTASGLEALAADTKGEYLNETCFLTSERWASEARVARRSLDGIDGLAALTDGLQLVAIDLATGVPHVPFFAPFFAFVSSDGEVGELEAFLASDRVAARTDDDVTLALAVLAP